MDADVLIELQLLAKESLNKDKYEETIALYEQCIAANPEIMSNYWHLGLALLLQGEDVAAQSVWLSMLAQGTDEQIEVWTDELIKTLEVEGRERLELGKYEQAEKIYYQIIEQNPNHTEAYKNLSQAISNQGRLEEAIAYYHQAIELAPDDAVTHNNLGTVWQRLGNLEEAIAYYQQAIKLNPQEAMIYNNLGTVFQKQSNWDDAIACYQTALNLNPNHALTHNNLGVVLQEQRQFAAAINCYNRAIAIDPNYSEPKFNRGLVRLRIGDYQRGFADYESRWELPNSPLRYFEQPVWDGRDLLGKTILLHQTEQGFGDTIQFIRYAPLVAQFRGEVIFECHKLLVRLLQTVAGIKEIVAVGTNLPQFDVHAPLLSLPYILKTSLDTLPNQIPYLSYEKFIDSKLEIPDKDSFKVGIVWAGNPEYANNHNRSCQLKQFLSILKIPGIAFYSLQKGSPVAELAEIDSQVLLTDLSDRLNDFADTAAVIGQLDLIITVDTAVAHLAGALGKPVWVLLSYNADWRWIVGRDDSPWYPTMRLFQQRQPRDWAEVFGRVELALRQLAV